MEYYIYGKGTNEHRNSTGTLLRNSLIAQLGLEPDLSENFLAESLKALSPDDVLKYLMSLHPFFKETSFFSSFSISELQQTLYILYSLGDGRSFEPTLIRQTASAANKHLNEPLSKISYPIDADKSMRILYRSGLIVPEENGQETTSGEYFFRCRTTEEIEQLTPFIEKDKIYRRNGFVFREPLKLYAPINLRGIRGIGKKHIQALQACGLIAEGLAPATTAFEQSLDGLNMQISTNSLIGLLK